MSNLFSLNCVTCRWFFCFAIDVRAIEIKQIHNSFIKKRACFVSQSVSHSTLTMTYELKSENCINANGRHSKILRTSTLRIWKRDPHYLFKYKRNIHNNMAEMPLYLSTSSPCVETEKNTCRNIFFVNEPCRARVSLIRLTGRFAIPCVFTCLFNGNESQFSRRGVCIVDSAECCTYLY
jgi:hypothetical protein